MIATSAHGQSLLKLEPVTVGETGSVSFSVGSPLSAEESDLEDSPEFDGAQGRFRLRAQVSGIVWQEPCACFRYEVVLLPAAGAAPAQRFKIKASPIGVFADQIVSVRFRVVAAEAELDHGEIRLPVASRRPVPDLVVGQPDDHTVPLQGRRTLTLQALNRSKDFGFILTPASTGVVAHEPALWAPLDHALTFTAVELTPGIGTPLQLALAPRLWPALEQSIWSPRLAADAPEGVHARVTVNLVYRNPIFDRAVPVSIEVPLRFKPDLGTLVLLLTGGVLIGSVLRLAFKRSRASEWVAETLMAWVAGLALELLGMLLVSFKSQFVLVGIDLNPFLPLPALVVGLIAGLSGRRAAEMVRSLVTIAKKPKPPQPAGAGSP